MIFAINVPQSKSVSIAFVSLKSMIFGIIATVTAKQIASTQADQQCYSALVSFTSILEVVFILGLIIDVFLLIYFYLNDSFKKIQYYIFFIFHLCVCLMCIFGVLGSMGSDGCDISNSLYSSVAVSAIILQINVLVTMISNLFIVLKYLHFGSNLVWLFIWIDSIECLRIELAMIAVIHTLLSMINVISLFVYKWFGKISSIVRCWKTSCAISLFMMLFCYLLILVGTISEQNCNSSLFFATLYVRYGLFQLISPLLILLFLRNEAGDPRQGQIKRHNEVFSRSVQNQNVNHQAKI